MENDEWRRDLHGTLNGEEEPNSFIEGIYESIVICWHGGQEGREKLLKQKVEKAKAVI